MAKKNEKQITPIFFDNAKLALAPFKGNQGDIATDYCIDTLYQYLSQK